MSSTTGLSSNGSNNKPANALQLDASARDSILARNQARVLSALGVTKKDEFNSGGGGLNPLKGLYSAAAATFLKNKQSQSGTGQGKGMGSYEKAADILKELANKPSSSGGSSASWQNTNTGVTGPASGANYKKYAWTGNPGPTGSDVIKEPEPVEEEAPVEEAAAPVDLAPVMKVFAGTVASGGGAIGDRGDGTSEFKVLDIAGTIGQKGDKLVGSVESDAGTFTFEIAGDGSVVIDASKGNTNSAEFDQLKHLLSGSLEGAKRKSAAEPAAEPVVKPAAEPAVEQPAAAVAAVTPDEQAAIDKAAADKAAADKAAADKAAADKAAAEAAAASADNGLLSGILTSSTSKLAALTGSGNSTDRGRYNAKLLVSDIQAAGGAAAVKDANTLNISLNGQAGTLTLKDDRLYGSLGSGSGAISFEIRANGEVKIEGNGWNATSRSNSLALRKAIGASTFGGTDFDARVVKFNRYGTGLGLNLLG